MCACYVKSNWNVFISPRTSCVPKTKWFLTIFGLENISRAMFLPLSHSTPATYFIQISINFRGSVKEANCTAVVATGIATLWLWATYDNIPFFINGGSKRKKGIRCIICRVLVNISGRSKRRHWTRWAPIECEMKIKFGIELSWSECLFLKSAITSSIHAILCWTSMKWSF